MSTDNKPKPELEIGHVLAMDLVGYSNLLIHEQSELQQRLNEIVRGTEQFRAADAQGKLIRLPTGDGMALVFFNDPKAPIECATEIVTALKNHSDIQLRMGIHSGPINRVLDVNERTNVAGAGIDLAQRVMDCGDAGHILLSKRVADDLAPYARWNPHLHDLGECEVKHGRKISLVNFYTDEVGNPQTPAKAREEKKQNVSAVASARRGKSVLVIGAVMVGLALAVAFWLLWKKSGDRHGQLAATNQASPAVAEKRIAILPFKPLVPENPDQILEIGMADTLITKLSRSREIIVASLTTVRKYGGLDQDPIAAGRDLGVSSILEGNVQKSGDHIRVTARLINVANGASLWAGTFDEKFTDVFTVQETISRKVADALALSLSGEEKMRLAKRETENVGAYQLYLTGRYHWNKLTPPELSKSISFFQQAIEMDPGYALAYAGLADAYRALAPTSDMRPKDVLPPAKAAALKAIELDGSLADPHASLAFIHCWFDWNWSEAERSAKQAIALNPNLGFAHSAYANVLLYLGRRDEAIIEAARGREIEPVSLLINMLEGSVLFRARHNDEAAVRLQKTLELDARFWIAHLFLGHVLTEKKQYAEALSEFSKARDFSGGNSETISMIGYVNAIAGGSENARQVLQELIALSAQRYIPPYNIAIVYLGLGQRDECFAWLEKAYTEHDMRLGFLRNDPKWDALRSDPRFISILKRIGLD